MAVLLHHKKCLVLTLVKKKKNFCLIVEYNHDNSYFFDNKKEICKFKTDNKNATFQLNFI